ncbi:Acetyltransferase (GNAT) domain-containing protein [Micromonospora pattaloongensis]|uniref:Acetyltransferase (GNAT) domain-containing protein n=1 Tax=Micromonospora pattaloongensis TaxID=405436 RepID=A0A1H3R2M2_9ACTN|nr:GNAT family N-acetyltransferase [Micromonospora pattaloongensis]SDZ19870.1 Acetyltransferase (GNAT) domain-containing protein [Micromonospora pattaloongensis]
MAQRMRIRRVVRLRRGNTFVWRPAEAGDAETIWGWWTTPGLAYWGTAPRVAKVGPPPHGPETVRDYLALPADRLGVEPVVGELDGRPVAYAETYAKRDSLLADVPLIEDEARGSHLLVDPTARVDRRIVLEVIVDAVDWAFETWPEARHYIGDPDIRNRSMVNLHKMLGMRQIAVVELPHKTACLVAVSRTDWTNDRERIASLIR